MWNFSALCLESYLPNHINAMGYPLEVMALPATVPKSLKGNVSISIVLCGVVLCKGRWYTFFVRLFLPLLCSRSGVFATATTAAVSIRLGKALARIVVLFLRCAGRTSRSDIYSTQRFDLFRATIIIEEASFVLFFFLVCFCYFGIYIPID